MKYLFSNKFAVFLCMCLVSLPVVVPYIREGYFPTHDGEWAVVRLADMYRTVRDLQIPARYSGFLNAGYGYPLFNFAYPFPYYLGLLPLALNMGFVGSIKFLFAISMPMSAFFMYLFSEKLWKSSVAGAISAVVYVYAPYRMIDLFVRGSIGESLSFVLFPLLFYLALVMVEKKKSVYPSLLFSLALALLIGTHNIMTVLFVPLLSLFIIVLIGMKNRESWRSFAFAFLLGLGLSAFFWLPALAEKHLIWLAEIPIADRSIYFVSLRQLVVPSWGFGPPTEPGGFSYQIGIAHVVIFFLSLGISLRYILSKKMNVQQWCVLLFTGITLLAILMMFRFSSYLWEIVPLLKEINYPWIMLSQVIFFIAVLAGYLTTRKPILNYAGIVLAVCAVVLTMPYVKPKEYVHRGDEFYVTNDAVTTSSDEYLPLWTLSKPPHRPDEKVEIEGQGTIRDVTYNSRSILFTADIILPSTVTVNTIYYPGWKLYLNDEPALFTYDNEYGVMQFSVDPGHYRVSGEFGETPLRMVANGISLFSVVIIALFVLAKPVQSTIIPSHE